jgi:dTDP-4-dehydrorhamnose 3,5-epimerase
MIFTPIFLSGAFVIELDKHEDKRGFFARFFCKREFSAHGLETRWVQINNSFNQKKGTMRGLHFQRPPRSEAKVVRCLRGSIWDVIVDLRKGSPSFGNWFGAELNEDNRSMIYVPRGFAHGFISITDGSEILYLTSEYYSPEYEETLRWDDPLHKIEWPATPKIISEKDRLAKDITIADSVEL